MHCDVAFSRPAPSFRRYTMRIHRWKRYTWDLTKLPEYESKLPSHFNVRTATREEEKAVLLTISSAFKLDTAWADSFKIVTSFIEAQIAAGFLQRSLPCLVITHGVRIIAASALNTTEEAPSNLITGPCVLAEYRSRGLGTALLHESLLHLKATGLQHASGICKENLPAGRFVYPKFGSASYDFDLEALTATT